MIARLGESSGSDLPGEGKSMALGIRAMMTIVSKRMNSKAPVSLVTTTATNESSPEPPNSIPEWPPRRLRRIRLLQTMTFAVSSIEPSSL